MHYIHFQYTHVNLKNSHYKVLYTSYHRLHLQPVRLFGTEQLLETESFTLSTLEHSARGSTSDGKYITSDDLITENAMLVLVIPVYCTFIGDCVNKKITLTHAHTHTHTHSLFGMYSYALLYCAHLCLSHLFMSVES